MQREAMLQLLEQQKQPFDFLVIGGGASGAGVAMEAASRGYSVALFEKYDFAKSTSGKSTKLIHGGVRYLAQGNYKLVREACVERGTLLKNAPHLVKNLSFIIPAYGWKDKFIYATGLKLYDLMAGSYSLGKSMLLGTKETLRNLPGLRADRLKGGILYHDGQFDDSRLLLNVLQTAAGLGAAVLNYMPVLSLLKDRNEKLNGLIAKDTRTGKEFFIAGKVIVNCTGVFSDEILQMDNPLLNRVIAPSQGVHLVLDKTFMDSDRALMIPKTDDGRVLFAVPWYGKILTGTTDTPLEAPSPEPVPMDTEIDFILNTLGKYLSKAPVRSDVKSMFAGLRPLAVSGKRKLKTREISRTHKILISPAGLFTLIGGKWTTFRKMGEDLVGKAEKMNGWKKTKSETMKLRIHGYDENFSPGDPLNFYGSDKIPLLELTKKDPSLNEFLSESLGIIKAQVIWAVRNEMAESVEDFLSRRTRCLTLDVRESLRIAPEVASMMAIELKKDDKWIKSQLKSFEELCKWYLPKISSTSSF